MQSALIKYQSLSGLQLRQLLDVELLPQQVTHVGDIHGGLHALTAQPSSDIQGFVLLVDDIPRGFFLLKRRTLLPLWADGDTATLHALMIDRRYQGVGLGKKILTMLPKLVQDLWPEADQMMLAVGTDNHAVRELYRALGWQDSAENGLPPTGIEQLMTFKLH